MAFTLPQLPYAYNALEPYFDAATMEIHHSRHHQAYVSNLNNALQDTHQNTPLERLMGQVSGLSPAVRNNGGGHWNHSFFWETLTHNTPQQPQGALLQAIAQAFGSLEHLKEQFTQAAMSRFGSGWAWLVRQKNGTLCVCSTPNQDNPLMDVAETKGTPLLGADVWEHAYYLKYQNKRADYLNAFWQLIHWEKVRERFEKS